MSRYVTGRRRPATASGVSRSARCTLMGFASRSSALERWIGSLSSSGSNSGCTCSHALSSTRRMADSPAMKPGMPSRCSFAMVWNAMIRRSRVCSSNSSASAAVVFQSGGTAASIVLPYWLSGLPFAASSISANLGFISRSGPAGVPSAKGGRKSLIATSIPSARGGRQASNEASAKKNRLIEPQDTGKRQAAASQTGWDSHEARSGPGGRCR